MFETVTLHVLMFWASSVHDTSCTAKSAVPVHPVGVEEGGDATAAGGGDEATGGGGVDGGEVVAEHVLPMCTP